MRCLFCTTSLLNACCQNFYLIPFSFYRTKCPVGVKVLLPALLTFFTKGFSMYYDVMYYVMYDYDYMYYMMYYVCDVL